MDDDRERVWELMEKIGICMLTTWDGAQTRARPMGANLRHKEDTVSFLTDARHHTDDFVARFPKVCLAFADTHAQTYVSVSGHATLSNDRATIRDLWSPVAKAYWNNPDDPNIRVLTVEPRDAEFWDGPGTVMSYVKMAAAAATGTRPDLGENRKVVM